MLEVGRIVKPHGLRGEVIVELFTNREERLDSGATLHTAGDVLVVRCAVRHQHRWRVSFAGIETVEDAETLRDTTLLAEPIDDPDALWVHDLIGSEALNASGERIGEVSAVVANPAGDLIEVDGKHLVPLRFVVEHGPGFVRVDPPPGLFDL